MPTTVTESELPWGQLKMTSFDLPWVTLDLTNVFWHLLCHTIYFPGLSQKSLAWSSSSTSCDFVTYRVAFRQLTYSDWKTSPWPECATHVHIKKWLLLLCNWAFWLICWSFTQFGIQHKKIEVGRWGMMRWGIVGCSGGDSVVRVRIKKAQNNNWNDLETFKISKHIVSEAFLCIILMSIDMK